MRKFLFILLMMSVFLTACGQTADPDTAQKIVLFAEAGRLYLERSSNQAEAIKAYSMVLNLDPSNLEAIDDEASYGRVIARLGQFGHGGFASSALIATPLLGLGLSLTLLGVVTMALQTIGIVLVLALPDVDWVVKTSRAAAEAACGVCVLVLHFDCSLLERFSSSQRCVSGRPGAVNGPTVLASWRTPRPS